jgi:hypothetical protein
MQKRPPMLAAASLALAVMTPQASAKAKENTEPRPN